MPHPQRNERPAHRHRARGKGARRCHRGRGRPRRPDHQRVAEKSPEAIIAQAIEHQRQSVNLADGKPQIVGHRVRLQLVDHCDFRGDTGIPIIVASRTYRVTTDDRRQRRHEAGKQCQHCKRHLVKIEALKLDLEAALAEAATTNDESEATKHAIMKSLRAKSRAPRL